MDVMKLRHDDFHQLFIKSLPEACNIASVNHVARMPTRQFLKESKDISWCYNGFYK